MGKTLLIRQVDEYTVGVLDRTAEREDRSRSAQIRVWLRESAEREEEYERTYTRAARTAS